jgi:hypothetical protein
VVEAGAPGGAAAGWAVVELVQHLGLLTTKCSKYGSRGVINCLYRVNLTRYETAMQQGSRSVSKGSVG